MKNCIKCVSPSQIRDVASTNELFAKYLLNQQHLDLHFMQAPFAPFQRRIYFHEFAQYFVIIAIKLLLCFVPFQVVVHFSGWNHISICS